MCTNGEPASLPLPPHPSCGFFNWRAAMSDVTKTNVEKNNCMLQTVQLGLNSIQKRVWSLSLAAERWFPGSWKVMPNSNVIVCLGLWPPDSLTIWYILSDVASAALWRNWRLKVSTHLWKGWRLKDSHMGNLWWSPSKNSGHLGSGELP